jgi:hypothetical protein
MTYIPLKNNQGIGMKKFTTSLAVSAALISGVANASENPFGATELPATGYMQLAEAEMACGANMKMDAKQTAEKAAADKKAEAANSATNAVKAAVPTPAVPAVPKTPTLPTH